MKEDELPNPVPPGISAIEWISNPQILVKAKQFLIKGCLISFTELTFSLFEYLSTHFFLSWYLLINI